MVSHSHIPINHLLKQIETSGAARGNRDVRPDWVARLIERTAEMFEPLTGVGRVGFQCQLAEDCWVVGLYLGATEIVGGREDGKSKYVNFEVNLDKLKAQFDRIDEFYWSAFPSPTNDAAAQARSFITLGGTVEGNPLRLQVFSIPPEDAGPGLKQFPNGKFEPF